MKERPILFKGPMVRAILEGQKNQTRRLVDTKYINAEIDNFKFLGCFERDGRTHAQFKYLLEPYVRESKGCLVGDLLWVREAYQEINGKKLYMADEANEILDGWTPSIHMPRAACRLILEVTDVKVERLQDMTENDAMCEGAELTCVHCGEPFCIEKCAMGACWKPDCGEEDFSFIAGFKTLWDSLAKPGFRWEDNPYVWVIEFRKVTE